MHIILTIFFVISGIFSILCAILDWDWFFSSRRAAPFVRIFGRNGARIFYIVLGLFIIIVGIIYGVIVR